MAPHLGRKVHEQFALEVVDYYLNVANKNKNATVKHFLIKNADKRARSGPTKNSKLSRNSLYRILRRYEKTGKASYSHSTGRPPKVRTMENMKKLAELFNANPSLSHNEAAHLMNMQRSTLGRIVNKMKISPNLREFPNPATDSQKELNGTIMADFIKIEPGVAETKCENNEFQGDISFSAHSVGNFLKKEVAKPKPKSIPIKALKKPPVEHCLVCLDSVTQSSLTPKMLANSKAIFMLKYLIGIDTDYLARFLTHSEGSCPSEWFRLCVNCHGKLEEAFSIHEEIVKLQRKLHKYKEEMTTEILHSTGKERLIGLHRRSRGWKGKTVARLAREFVELRSEETEEKPWETHFRGDEEAELLRREKFPIYVTETTTERPETEVIFASVSANQDDVSLVNSENRNEEMMHTEFITEDSVGQNLNPVQSSSDIIPVIPAKVSAICDICGEDLKFCSLINHKFRKHGIITEGFTFLHCDVVGCNYKTFARSLLIKHKTIKHNPNNVSAYPCQYCGKEFATRNYLFSHESIHKNAESRPYKCDLCDSSFAVSTYLYIHKKNSHKNGRMPTRPHRRKKSKYYSPPS